MTESIARLWITRALAAMLALALFALAQTNVSAIINPALQPADLFRRFNAVMVAQVEVDESAKSLVIEETSKGTAPTAGFALGAAAGMERALAAMAEGERVVIFAGRDRPASLRRQALIYDGSWLLGELGDEPASGARRALTLTQAADAAGDDASSGERVLMAGTFNGSVDALARLVDDLALGIEFMPALPHVAFAEEMLLEVLDDAVVALSIIDIDGDGNMDIAAASPAGDRIFLQLAPREYVAAEDTLGLRRLASVSHDFADIDGDGDLDLLAGGVILTAKDGIEERFTETSLLPGAFASESENQRVRRAAFVEIDGDGRPDVLMAVSGSGLVELRNPGAGAAFIEIGKSSGLTALAADAHGFVAGDLSGDGRLDVLALSPASPLLVQDENGAFKSQPSGLQLEYDSKLGGAIDIGARAALAALFDSPALDLAMPLDARTILARRVGATLVDVTGSGNEISEASICQRGVLAADLNADGYLDLYTTTWKSGRSNRLHLYRGYGTYMNALKYKADALPGPTHERGGCMAAAAGDLDGDGAIDLVLGGAEGEIVIFMNQILDTRKPIEHPTREVEVLAGIGHIVVDLSGATVGAHVEFIDSSGRFLGRREAGGGAIAGGRGPDQIVFAARATGKITVRARMGDGQESTATVDVTPRAVSRIRIGARTQR